MKKRKTKRKVTPLIRLNQAAESLSLHTEVQNLKEKVSKLLQSVQGLEDRMQDAEIHINLLTRLLTTLCVEKFGMRIGVLKRLIKRIEKEAIRDSQIMHLESLYQMPAKDKKGQPPSSSSSKNDPWDQIS